MTDTPSLKASRGQTFSAQSLALIAVFAALIAVCAISPSIPVGPLGVPITLQTFAIYIAALCLGGWRGASATALYLLAGLVGLPVFSQGKSGFGVLFGPSAGYLIGFIPAAFIVGTLGYRVLGSVAEGARKKLLLLGSALSGSVLLHFCGVLGMMVNGQLGLKEAVLADLLYVPGDIIKCIGAVLVALAVHRAFPALAGGKAS